MADHQVVSHEKWIEARRALLAREKEFTRLRDQLSQQRRDLPWERVDKPYAFEGPNGTETLAQLFDGRSQLVIYHFMYGPDSDTPCKSCSFWVDNIERNVVHLNARDVTFVVVSRAPLAKLEAFKQRMGWTFKWVSSGKTDFNFDYNVSWPDGAANGGDTYNYAAKTWSGTEMPGISVFHKDPSGAVFHTYSCYSRGIDMMNGAYQYLDLVPKGRDESGLSHTMAWVRYRDSYGR
jgi:predicted dithiol-disulfide oxidoreductase (DUF899 family)